MKLDIKCEICGYGDLKKTNDTTVFYCPTCDEEYSLNELEIKEVNVSEFADHLIENASYAFEHQDRELLEKVLSEIILSK